MPKLSSQEIIDLAVNKYFKSVDEKNIVGILNSMNNDIQFKIITHNIIKNGKKEVEDMMIKLFKDHKKIWHGNFTHTIDIDYQKIASTFTVKNTEHNDSIATKYNCNFFEITNGKFSSITVYMQGDNTLN